MKARIPDVLLLIALTVGAVLAWRTGVERSRLAAEHRRLARFTGDLRVVDPTQAHILALDTGEPMHFAWRVYLPPNYPMQWSNGPSGGSGSMTTPYEFIARVRFREEEDGLHVYSHLAGASTGNNLGGPELAGLLRGRWDQLLVERLGSKEPAQIAPGGSAVLLRVTLPEAMQAEARSRLSPDDQIAFIPSVFRVTLGPNPPAKPGK